MDPTARPSAADSTPGSFRDPVEEFASTVYARLKTRGAAAQRYRIGDEIGHGGMGRVYSVHDEDLHRDVAMKVIREVKGEDGAPRDVLPRSIRLARFLEEAQVTGQLDHPSIVPVHELGLDSAGHVYFTMKLVRGEDLSAVLERARRGDAEWTETRVVGALLRVCEAMAYAHSKGVIHRDLKPSNIRIGRFGAVYVMDWGLARVLARDEVRDLRVRELDPAVASRAVHSERDEDSPAALLLHTMDGTPIGTPAFMSPEQALGLIDRMGPHTDVYGLGAILYTLLTGQSPYVKPLTQVDALQIVRWIKQGPPDPVLALAPRATPELVAICEKAMSRDPAARYPDMSELADELRAYLESRVVRAYRSGPWTELVMWVRRNRQVAALSIALLVLFALGGFGLAWQRGIAAYEARRNSDAFEAVDLVRELEQLAPLDPSVLPELDGWFARAARLVERRTEYQAEMETLVRAAQSEGQVELAEQAPDERRLFRVRNARADRERYAEELLNPSTRSDSTVSEQWKREYEHDLALVLPREVARLEALFEGSLALEQRRTVYRFVDERIQQRHDALASLIADFTHLEREAWREAERLYDVASWSHGPTDDEWSRAWERLAQDSESPAQRALHGPLALRPRRELLPLQRNALSGLWEFWHIPSGTRPESNGASGWAIGADTGVVLVLIPGGTALIGASSDPCLERHDPNADPTEFISRVELDPFLLSKYELTQGQWLRLAGSLPSQYAVGGQWHLDPRVSLANPVELVSYEECRALLARLGLTLPTEAQFEYAARAGCDAPWPDEDGAALHAYANHYDATAMRSQGADPSEAPGVLDDRRMLHAAAGTYGPNAFGLHEMLGNVAEWCLDWYVSVPTGVCVTPRSGERVPTRATERVVRGGDFVSLPPYVRLSSRSHAPADSKSHSTGLRPVLRFLEQEFPR